MCCFTRPVQSVNATKIFARADQGERQFLVYSMKVESKEDLAMVLPLPVKPGSGEKAVTFISLKDYPDFFDDLEKGFPAIAYGHGDEVMALAALAPLAVVQVGNFEASFVPTVKDFARLDARFRLPEGAWKKLPSYRDYGFAVFKLKPGLQNIHPMAFSFPRRDLHTLFFPTVHIHDGEVHPKAEFDHVLYSQPKEGEPLKFGGPLHWQESPSHARSFMKMAKTQGLIEPDQHCYKTAMNGDLPNRDTFVLLES
ncbi:MAG: hypothetical protein JWQ04_2598 [Pedosphaera sp.]|nr:hypothetical protein [Pedosphaera sp.]